jgi:5-methylcytosine-specific restriction endonuclease McrA
MYLGDKINPLCLFALCNWMCGVCGKPIDRSLRYPNPMCATVDHIIPLASGGSHTWDNVQASHKYCNEIKGCAVANERLVQ